jgi:prepilin-type N-terminal cleavage/methylation domain-containing protein
MKRTHHLIEKGFTAVELLITLFIAAIFLFAGYQLYIQVLKDGADASKTALMSNAVYERLRKEIATVTDNNPAGCTTSTLSPYPKTETPTISGFSSVTYTVSVSCPMGTAKQADLFLVSVSSSYNDSTATTKVLKHATYAN